MATKNWAYYVFHLEAFQKATSGVKCLCSVSFNFPGFALLCQAPRLANHSNSSSHSDIHVIPYAWNTFLLLADHFSKFSAQIPPKACFIYEKSKDRLSKNK